MEPQRATASEMRVDVSPSCAYLMVHFFRSAVRVAPEP